MELNEKLAGLRREQGITQDELAQKVGVTRQAVSKWERGVMAPSTESLIALGRLYGIPLDELVNGPPPQEEPAPAGEAPPDAPPESATALRWSALRKRVGAAVMAGCILLAGLAARISIGVAVSKEPEKQEDGIIWTDDIVPEYIDLNNVIYDPNAMETLVP